MKLQAIQSKVLKALSGKIDDFYLVGGTALSLYYFHHRVSEDLDFFTQDFKSRRIEQIIKYLSGKLNKKIMLKARQTKKDMVRISVYLMHINKDRVLKMDFVEDFIPLIKLPKPINGIKVLSLEDIYLRKVYTIAGTHSAEDLTGRTITMGGRQDPKDFYDLYCLSNIFMPLSEFSFKFCNPVTREGIIRWFRTYSRLDMKTVLLDLELKKEVDYKKMERHFKEEIGRIIEKEI